MAEGNSHYQIKSLLNMTIDTVFSRKQIMQLDTIIDHRLDKLSDHPQMSNSIAGYVVLVVILLAIAATCYFYFKKRTFGHEHRRNAVWVMAWFLFITAFFTVLICFGIIHLKKDTIISEGDMLLLLSTVIAIIGCVWAIFARIDAERAFQQAKLTYESFGNSFDFKDIFIKGIIKKMIDKIGSKETTMHLFIGFPVIGYFASDKAAFKDNEPLDTFIDLCAALQKTSLLKKTSFKLKMSVLPKAITIQWMEKKEIPPTDRLFEQIIHFYDKIVPNFPADGNIIIKQDFQESEKLRFILIEEHGIKKCTCDTWVIPEFDKDTGFESAGFSSSDSNLVRVLKDVL